MSSKFNPNNLQGSLPRGSEINFNIDSLHNQFERNEIEESMAEIAVRSMFTIEGAED